MLKIFLIASLALMGLAYGYTKDAPSSGMKSAAVSAFGQPEYADEAFDMGLRYVQVKLASTAIKTLNSSPVLVVSSPGSGKALLPVAVYGSMDYRSSTYVTNSNESLDIEYGNSGSGDIGASLTYLFMESAADKMVYTPAIEVHPLENTALFAHISGGNPTTGDSDIYLRIYYRIVPFPLTQ